MRKRKKLAPTPVLRKGTYTGYRVLDKLEQVLLDEPRRLDMSTWLRQFKGEPGLFAKPKKNAPECGTVGCAAGWINVITRQVDEVDAPLMHSMRALTTLIGPVVWGAKDYEERASARADLNQIFNSTKLRVPGVVKQLRAFRERYKDLLTAKEVVVE